MTSIATSGLRVKPLRNPLPDNEMSVTPEGKERGKRIKAAREHAKLSQEAVADALTERMQHRVRQTHVSRWERGANKPSDRYAKPLADLLDVAMGWLLNGVESGAPAPPWYAGDVVRSSGSRKGRGGAPGSRRVG